MKKEDKKLLLNGLSDMKKRKKEEDKMTPLCTCNKNDTYCDYSCVVIKGRD